MKVLLLFLTFHSAHTLMKEIPIFMGVELRPFPSALVANAVTVISADEGQLDDVDTSSM